MSGSGASDEEITRTTKLSRDAALPLEGAIAGPGILEADDPDPGAVPQEAGQAGIALGQDHIAAEIIKARSQRADRLDAHACVRRWRVPSLRQQMPGA
jgi:hypothetical protein